MTTMRSVVSRVKSKNAGPFRLTFDLIFDSEAAYQRVKTSGRVTESEVAELYGIPEDAVIGIYFVDFVRSIKISVKRPIPQGHPDETDVFGMNQHNPLLELEID